MTVVVHTQTIIQTTFGVLDDDGNIIPQQPIEVRIAKFSIESFVEAHDMIVQTREEAQAAMDATEIKP